MDAKKNLVVDVAALAVYLVAANPALTGVGLHEWLGIGVFVVFLVHCAMHAGAVGAALRDFGRIPWGAKGNLVLDALVLAAFMVVTVSGLLISGAVLPAFGLYAGGYYFWDPLHAIAAKALLALLLVHVVVHWRWVASFSGKGKGDVRADAEGCEDKPGEMWTGR